MFLQELYDISVHAEISYKNKIRNELPVHHAKYIFVVYTEFSIPMLRLYPSTGGEASPAIHQQQFSSVASAQRADKGSSCRRDTGNSWHGGAMPRKKRWKQTENNVFQDRAPPQNTHTFFAYITRKSSRDKVTASRPSGHPVKIPSTISRQSGLPGGACQRTDAVPCMKSHVQSVAHAKRRWKLR